MDMERSKLDRKLWERYLAGDKAALGELYRVYHRRLTMYCYGRLEDKGMAENAASDTLMRLLEHKDEPPIVNMEAWLFSVAKNLCNSRWQKENRRRGIFDKIQYLFSGSEENKGASQLRKNDLKARIAAALNEKELEVWNLHQRGFGNEEIAKQLGMNAKTVANMKAIARNKLKLAMDKYRNQHA